MRLQVEGCPFVVVGASKNQGPLIRTYIRTPKILLMIEILHDLICKIVSKSFEICMVVWHISGHAGFLSSTVGPPNFQTHAPFLEALNDEYRKWHPMKTWIVDPEAGTEPRDLKGSLKGEIGPYRPYGVFQKSGALFW